jgi:hypothetical protein
VVGSRDASQRYALLAAVIAGLLATVATVPLVQASVQDDYVQEGTLMASDGEGQSPLAFHDEGDRFGTGLAIQDDRALVGAPYADDADGEDAGAVYMYEHTDRRGWVEAAKIQPAWSHSGSHFGQDLALDGDRLVVGAPGHVGDDRRGAVFVFQRQASGNWTQQARVSVAPDGSARIGQDVDVDGDTILVGSRAYSSSSVHVLEQHASGVWLEAAHLDNGADSFGTSFSIHGDTALVRDSSADVDGQTYAGKAFVYERTADGWQRATELVSPDTDGGTFFGSAVALHGDTALVGEAGDGEKAPEAGAAHVFTRETAGWAAQAKLLAEDGNEDEALGTSVALDGDRAVVGAGDPHTRLADRTLGPRAGAGYVFADGEDGWEQRSKLRAADGALTSWQAALDAERVLVGEPGKNNANGFEAGSAYVFAPAKAVACAGLGGGSP